MSVKTYVRKSDGAEVQAIRLTEDNTAKVAAFRGLAKYYVSHIHKTLVFPTKDQVAIYLRYTEWIVLHSTGNWGIVSDFDFKRQFRLPDTPELANLKAQAKAATESVEVWKNRLTLLQSIKDGMGCGNCPLCVLNKVDETAFHPDCSKCPVCLRTGKEGCINTPYRSVQVSVKKAILQTKGMIELLSRVEIFAIDRVKYYGSEVDSE